MIKTLSRNLKKSINLSGKRIRSGGAFSSYYKLNKTQGIKVLYSDGHKSVKALRNSLVWRRATKENTLLRKCKQRYFNIPHSYGVSPVKIGKCYYPGIMMQHIDGILLTYLETIQDTDKQIISEKLSNVLSKVGIYHNDLHWGNIILAKDKITYYVIDFTYDLVELDNGQN